VFRQPGIEAKFKLRTALIELRQAGTAAQ